MKTTKMVLAGTVSIFALTISSDMASAQILDCPIVSLGLVTGTCRQQDKLWGQFEVDIAPQALTTTFNFILLQHTITFTAAFQPNAPHVFEYVIEVEPVAANEFLFIGEVSGGIVYPSTPSGTSSLVKLFENADNGDDLATIVLGPAASVLNVPITPTKRIKVTDTLFTDGDNISAFSNTFVQVVLPPPPPVAEPMTLSLVGLGLASLGFAARRRRVA